MRRGENKYGQTWGAGGSRQCTSYLVARSRSEAVGLAQVCPPVTAQVEEFVV